MFAYHNSQSQDYRQPFGAVPLGAEVQLWLDVRDPPSGLQCSVRMWQKDKGVSLVPMQCESWGETARFSARLTMPAESGLVWYSFVLRNYQDRTFYGVALDGLGGEGQMYGSSPKSYQITVYRPAETPDWYKNGIAYQIFPDRFSRGSDWLRRQAGAVRPDGWKGPKRMLRLSWDDVPQYDRLPCGDINRWDIFGGTLEGIREKLRYLQSLGVTVLYLNPIFEAASNHKYDTADYLQVDPAFGDDESFQALVDEAKSMGMRIILDGVFSHTGADSRYFNRFGNYGSGGAAQDPDSPYAAWYRFQKWPDEYESWWGVKDLPNVEELEPAYTDFICGKGDSVIRHWLKKGIGGWRLDVADELPDAFIRDIRAAMDDEAPDSVLLGEVWEDASNKISYGNLRAYLLGDELHSTMNYPFREAALNYMLGRISPYDLRRRLMSLMENYPKESFYSALNLIGSHDRPRILTLLGDAPEADAMSEADRGAFRLSPEKYDLARRRLKILSLLQFTMPGLPCIYYGDEAGMQGYADPYNRGTYPWGRQDPDLMAHYRTITTLRRQYPVLSSGSYEAQAFGGHVYGCRRAQDGTVIQVLLNRGIFIQETEVVTLEAEEPYALDLLTARWLEARDGKLNVELQPLSGVMLLWCREKPEKAPRERSAGVVCSLAAIPSRGKQPVLTDGRAFVDFLEQAGQKLWQVLPINPAGEGGSPYSSPGCFAGDTRYIDRGAEPDWKGYPAFRRENRWWLEDYALFTVLKEANHGALWYQWPEEERRPRDKARLLKTHAKAVEQVCRDQYWFWTQWGELKDYAHQHGVQLIGDLPLAVAADSADVWAAPQLFQLDDQTLRPVCTAGVPPDYYNEKGQNWENPVYDWDAMAADGYRWWIRRIAHGMRSYDFIRLDHFRGFSEYFAIPAGQEAAMGSWRLGPGMALFQAVEKALGGPLPLLGEDLGSLDTAVYDLLQRTGFPGMDVIQFEQRKMESAAPEAARERIYYGSTHDSQTLLGWCQSACPDQDAAEASDERLHWLYRSEAVWVLTQLQDLLALDNTACYNVPGTVSPKNWSWRAKKSQLTAEVAGKFAAMAQESDR